MTTSVLDPCFVAGSRGRLFVAVRRPTGGAAGAVLIVPPFADEMNKSRKMMSDVAQALAARGVATVVADPFGTGDSAGDFRDADWDGWVADLVTAADWSTREGLPIVGLLAIRLGALLAARVAQGLPRPVARSVFWQPVTDGQRFMTQFLRMRVAASLMEDRKESITELRERIQTGQLVEVGGYELGSALLAGIDAARLVDRATSHLGALTWLEVASEAGDGLPAPSLSCIEVLRQRLPEVTSATMVGEPFWTSTEIVRIPALVARTAAALAGAP